MALQPRNMLGISTISMGWHESHTLECKLAAASRNGFEGVEIFSTDFRAFADEYHITLIAAARLVRRLCQQTNLSVICFGSFDNFENARSLLSERLTTASQWIEIAQALVTDMIQVTSNDDPTCSGEETIMVSELRQLADLGNAASPPIRFAYEALGWGTHVADWEEALRIVELVDRDNFGLCLDTYHVLARLWANPAFQNGKRPGGTAALNASIKRFLGDCPPQRIFYVQLSDAERCEPPLLPGHAAYAVDKDAVHAWCSWGRVFPGEGYLPMTEICRAWLQEKGWRGWVSMEIFHRDMKAKANDPQFWAQRGRASWDCLQRSLT